MDEQVAAYIYKRAPGEKRGEWHQRGLKRVLTGLKSVSPADHQSLVTNGSFEIAVGFHVYPTDLGQYGHDAGFQFVPDLDTDLLEDVENAESLCEEFYERWIGKIREVIEEEQKSSLFSPKELATLYAYRNPTETEAMAADALEISIGTYRGKVGRVKDKLTEARATLELDEFAQLDSRKEWNGGGYSAPLTVIDRVDEDRLPVQASHRVSTGNIHEWDVEDLIRE